MQIRLTRKLANAIDGIDVSRRHVGDLINLPEHDAAMLIAEGWASPAALQFPARAAHRVCAEAMRGEARINEQLRHIREHVAHRWFESQPPQRRAEDRIREELQDSRATTVHQRQP
jgi:hypothetical protein